MDIRDPIVNAASSIDNQSIIQERVLIMSKEQLDLYDKVRPWASIHEHITNNKFSSEGKRRFGHRIYLSKEF